MKAFYLYTLFLIMALPSGLLYAQDTGTNNAGQLFTRGKELQNAAKYEEAAGYFDVARNLFLQQGDSAQWLNATLHYGETLVNRGLTQQGLNLFLQADSASFQQKTLSVSSRIKNNIGWAYLKLENIPKQKEYYLEGLALAKEADDALMTARIYSNLALVYQDTGELDKALTATKQAISTFRSLDEKRRLAIALNNARSILQDLGLYDLAEEYMRESIAIREELNNPDLLDVGYHNLAYLFESRGQRDSSVIYYQKSLKISRQLGNPLDITQTLTNIGDLYFQSGNYQVALQYYEEALDINKRIKRPLSLGRNFQNLGDVYLAMGDLAGAEENYQHATIYKPEYTEIDVANLNLDLAKLETQKGNYQQALTHAEKALAIGMETGHTTILYRSYNSRAHILTLLGNYEKSIAIYKKVYSELHSLPRANQVSAIMNLARAFHKMESDSAFFYAEMAFDQIQELRNNVYGVNFRAGFFREHARFYNEVASWYITQKSNSRKAYELVEASKARVLLDELAEAEEEIFHSLDEATLVKKQQKTKQIDRLHRELARETDSAKKAELQHLLRDVEFEYQTFINEIKLQNEAWKNFEYPEPITAAQARNLIDGERTAIIEYAFSGDELLTFFITKNSFEAHITDSAGQQNAREYITTHGRTLRDAISAKTPTDSLSSVSGNLYYPLFRDFLHRNPDIEQLIIIPDGVLSFLPFEAIMRGNRYLIQDFEIKYLPSVSIYSFIKKPHRSGSSGLLALAGSGFETGTGLDNTRSQASFASLPSTILEVDSIASNFPQHTVLKNENVTEAGLKKFNLDTFRYIHFATHGNIDEENPSQSGLILSKKQDMETLFGEDGYLNSVEISTFQLNSDLVVLSACNTGMGKIIHGEGLLGLQRSFLTAGSSSVIVSLWNVYDKSTALFMDTFYSTMLTFRDREYGLWEKSLDYFGLYEHPLFDYKSKALRDAKLEMINHPYYNHPVYWAPFILIGK